MGRADFLYTGFISRLKYAPTTCQEALLRKIADFVSGDDSDILVVNGYAGTGKTTAISSVISLLKEYQTKCVLLAPTGRAAKVLSSYAGQPAFTVHKHIYRQKSVGGDGFGQFTLAPNKDKNTLFIVDEASLIGIDAGQQQSTAAFGTGNLLDDLISFVRAGAECKVILIGDSAQLPPVGLDASPALMRDYMSQHGGVGFAELTTVVRQQQESGILHNATMVRHMIAELEDGIGVMDLCDLGLEVEEREVCLDELENMAECGLCGTAAVISPVGKIVDHGKEICLPSGMTEMGPITKKLYETLTGIQMGTIPAPEGWIVEVC